jgi:hypothetical protein
VSEEKLPRAQVRDGKLYIEGEKEPYVQGAIRHLRLTIRKLRYHRIFEVDDDGKVRQGGWLRGTAIIEGDALTVAGSGLPKVREIPFSLREALEPETKYHWQMSIGFLPHDWEIGNDDEYYCECYAPESMFTELVKAYLIGKAEQLKVLAHTKLWVRQVDWHKPVGIGVTWYLVPSTDRQSDMPDHVRGNITQLSWSDGPIAEPPADLAEEPRSQATDRTAHLAVLRKISSSLIAILVTLIVLAAIVLLKH